MNYNPLDYNYFLTSPSSDSFFGPFSIVYFVVFLIGTIVSNYFYFYGKYRFKSNLLTYTMVNRTSRNAAIVFTAGFLFFLCRLAQLPPFSARIWLDVTIVGLVYIIVRGILWRSRSYAKAKAEWETIQQRNRRREGDVAAPASTPKVAAVRETVPATNAVAASAADAGSEEAVIRPAVPTRQGLSERGQKRRERKRKSR